MEDDHACSSSSSSSSSRRRRRRRRRSWTSGAAAAVPRIVILSALLFCAARAFPSTSAPTSSAPLLLLSTPPPRAAAARRGGVGRMRMGESSPPNSGKNALPPPSSPFPAKARLQIGGMALAGTVESAFLSYHKVFGGSQGIASLCGASGGCQDVLSGPYSTFWGVPLTLPAMLLYGTVAWLSLSPLLSGPSSGEEEVEDERSRSGILVLTTAMATFSGYLLSLLVFQIGHFCPYCVVSAALSFGMCSVAWANGAVPNKTKAAVMGMCTSLVTVMGSLLIFFSAQTAIIAPNGIASAAVASADGGGVLLPPDITASSDGRSVRLAKHLNKKGAKMFGAYWCSHCHHQKEVLGRQAFGRIEYVECAAKGYGAQTALCAARGLPGYPTWEIDGELYPGEKTVEELEVISGLKKGT